MFRLQCSLLYKDVQWERADMRLLVVEGQLIERLFLDIIDIKALRATVV
jgi:hypothetical protein